MFVSLLLAIVGSSSADSDQRSQRTSREFTRKANAKSNTKTTMGSTLQSSAKSRVRKSDKRVWRPPLNVSWHWMIDHPLDLENPKDIGLHDPAGNVLSTPEPMIYDIDGEFNSAATVAALHSMGKRVICYIDVGAYESYRADASSFPKRVRGKPDSHWEGSYWLDIRQRKFLLPIMRERMQMCKAKGFDAIEPDEMDGYANDTGFDVTYDDQLAYNRSIAEMAHEFGLSVGLKGDIDQAHDLWPYFDWTLNEQCFQYDECDKLVSSFIAHGKSVFQVEYDDPHTNHRADVASFCPRANRSNFNSMKMPLDLNGGREPCR
jgi:endo-alpha-1,4-polygalactosaminidase (GH114 family)